MSLRLLTESEMSATAVERWRKAYEGWSDDDRFSRSVGGLSKGETNALLNASDQTPAEIAEILNEAWARPKCDVCGSYVASAVLFSDEWSDGAVVMCAACVGKAGRMLRVAIGALSQ